MSDYKQKVNTIIAHIRKDDGDRKQKLCKGIGKYLAIQSMYRDNVIDETFLDLFYSFYGLGRQKPNIDRAGLQNLLQTGRNRKQKASRIRRNTSAIWILSLIRSA